ncbi:MAG: signal peptidase I [Nitrospinae bacterium]|nr:signal peptidase I [Nitrospinota bacterium]
MIITDAKEPPHANPRGLRLLVCMAVLSGLWLAAASRVHVNASWSDGAWGYFALPMMGAPERGDLVLFDPPENIGSPIPYMKRVIGLPGDSVAVDGKRRVFVNGVFAGIAKRRALNGRELETVAAGVIPPGRYYVHAEHPDSHDSRYREVGLVPLSRIRGRALPLPDLPWLGLKGPLAKPEGSRP